MALASRAAEMLRELEEKPEPALQPPGPITNANGKVEVVETSTQSPYRGAAPPDIKEMLSPFIKRDDDDLKIVPIGHYFTLDPPKVEDVTERGVKWWYKLSAGKCPQFYLRDRPGVEFRMEAGGPRFVRFVTASKQRRRVGNPYPFVPRTPSLKGLKALRKRLATTVGAFQIF
jgi:hypothetical protein